MPIDLNDLRMIEQYLSDKYVHVAECADTQERVNKKLANDDKRIEVIYHDFKIIKWLISTVAASSVGALVVSIFEILMK